MKIDKRYNGVVEFVSGTSLLELRHADDFNRNYDLVLEVSDLYKGDWEQFTIKRKDVPKFIEELLAFYNSTEEEK